MEFVVIAPSHLLDGYKIVLRDEDVESLQIQEPSAAMVLNIVAIHSHEPQYVTVNLVGPIVVNRYTLIGQQVIIENSSDFSIEHVLVDQRQENNSNAAGTSPIC
jgi:flagellar assembly factor FliW